MCWAHCHTSIITKDSVEAGSLKVYNESALAGRSGYQE
jgi:hypothetical protein